MKELISRAVILQSGYILCAHREGMDNIFLPGGHIEENETPASALERELLEELGTEADAGTFLGIAEHGYTRDGTAVQEINFIFRTDIPGLSPDGKTRSAETHLEFMWIACAKHILSLRNLQPWVLQEALPRYAAGEPFPCYLSTLSQS